MIAWYRKKHRLDINEVPELLKSLNGKSYRLYKKLYNYIIDYGVAIGYFTRVQGDPYAPPSYYELRIRRHRFPKYVLENKIPFTDYLHRIVYRITKSKSRKCGTGNSCYIGVPKPSNKVIYRSSVEVLDRDILVRLFIGLPARGRRILGSKATKILVDTITSIINGINKVLDNIGDLEKHIELYNEQEYIRQWLEKEGYIAFIADNSVLPRESSISEKPLKKAVPFKTPETMKTIITLPNGRKLSGFSIKKGITVIIGGGYHGKSTLLQSIMSGIYNHVRGDGREYVVSVKDIEYVKAENGRIINNVDISSFIDSAKLPEPMDTKNFYTLNASGSTSMAASISEAIESKAKAILIDEDTSATNLLYKDNIMNKIIAKEPIRELNKQARDLYKKTGTSLLIVISASSEYLLIADTIVLMENYILRDIRDYVKKLVRIQENSSLYNQEYYPPGKRVFYGIRDLVKVKAKGYRLIFKYRDNVVYELDLRDNPRIIEKTQVKMIAAIINKIKNVEEPMEITTLMNYIDRAFTVKGFKVFIDPVPPDLAFVYGRDVVWVLNRLYNAVFK